MSNSKNPSTPSLPYHHYHNYYNHKRISANGRYELYTPSQMQTQQQHKCCPTYIPAAIFQLAETCLCAGSPVHPFCESILLRSHVLPHLCSVSFLYAPFGVVTIFSCWRFGITVVVVRFLLFFCVFVFLLVLLLCSVLVLVSGALTLIFVTAGIAVAVLVVVVLYVCSLQTSKQTKSVNG